MTRARAAALRADRPDRAPHPAQDQRIARILARQRAGQHDAGRQLGLQVLQAVHGEVDPAVQQRLVDLLGEQPLAADLRQRPVLHRVAGGADDVLLEHVRSRSTGQNAQRVENRRVCISASGEPRVPTRSGSWLRMGAGGGHGHAGVGL